MENETKKKIFSGIMWGLVFVSCAGIGMALTPVLGPVGLGVGLGLFVAGWGAAGGLAFYEKKIFEKLGWNEIETEKSSLTKNGHENTHENTTIASTATVNTISNSNTNLNQQPSQHPTPSSPVPANAKQTEIPKPSVCARIFGFFAKKFDEAHAGEKLDQTASKTNSFFKL